MEQLSYVIRAVGNKDLKRFLTEQREREHGVINVMQLFVRLYLTRSASDKGLNLRQRKINKSVKDVLNRRIL